MTPRVPVVVPTYKRPELLALCRAALAAQTLPADRYEVVVVEDVSAEGPATARNRGWRQARGDVIAFTDDDTIPDPGWLAAGLGAFDRDPDLAAAAGRTEVPLPPRPTDYERNESGLATAEFVTANCFVRQVVLKAVGGFDERFRVAWREDSDLHFALLERGLKVMKVPDAVVVHPVRPARWGVSLRKERKSQYDALLCKKHPGLYHKRLPTGRPWPYYAIVAALVIGIAALLAGWPATAVVAAAVWLVLTARFAARRLRGNSLAPGHVAEVVVTSALIPPLSVFWRLYGGVKFRTAFV
jgi:GT2 family glycosyltransferase